MRWKDPKRRRLHYKNQTKDATSQQEETIGSQLKSINNYDQHYAGIMETCPIELSKIEDNELKKCDFIGKTSSKRNAARIRSQHNQICRKRRRH